MNHSTTATSTHTILKYSKSHFQNTTQQTLAEEWQHFSNPTIRLVLDVKKSNQSELESVRLRIIWVINPNSHSMDLDQREVVFEDLDLLSFSSLESRGGAQGLPLKAVYRDSVVGIRYQHPQTCPADVTPAYRRFQMTFPSPSAASQFIDSISSVCPCKANPPPPPAAAAAGNVSSSSVNNKAGRAPTKNAPTVSNPRRTYTATIPSTSPALEPSQNSNSDFNMQTSSPASAAIPTTNKSGPVIPYLDVRDSPIPNPSPPSSSVNSNSMPPPPPPPSSADNQNAAGTSASHHDLDTTLLIASLREGSQLYNLTNAQLEEMVGEVVREPGFGDLLKNLDSLWRVKGLAAQ